MKRQKIKITERAMGKIIEKSEEANSKIRADLIRSIMEETGWSYEEVIRACCGSDEERVPEYSMYWKIARWTTSGMLITKKRRNELVEICGLDEEEKRIFFEKWENERLSRKIGKMFTDAEKEAKAKQGK